MKQLLSSFYSLLSSKHRRIAKSILLISLFVGVGKLAGAAKEMAIAYKYGTSEIVDLYVLVFTLALWIPSVWASVSTSVLVPLTSSMVTGERKKFHKELLGWLLIFSAILALLLFYLLAPTVELLGKDLKSGTGDMMNLVVGLSIVALFSMLIFHLNALLLVEERHLNTLLNGIPSLTLLIFIISLSGVGASETLAIGSVVGALIHMGILIWLLRKSNLFGSPVFAKTSIGWSEFYKAVGIMVLSNVVISFAPIIDQVIASSLPDGSNATLGYSVRLLALFLGLSATAVGRAILPILSKEQDIITRLDLIQKWFFILFVIGFIVLVIAWFFAPLVVKIMYERGAFSPDDTLRVYETLRFGLLQIPFYISGIVLVQYFASRKLYKTLLYSSVIALTVKIACGYGFAVMYGVRGIALSTSLMYVGTFAFLFYSIYKERLANNMRGI